MARGRPIRGLVTLLLAFVLLVAWYVVATGYGYSELSGTYKFNGPAVSTVLVLKADRSFLQEITKNGKVEHSTGSWHRIGEGGVTFSKEFIRLPGQQSYLDRFGPDTSGNPESDGEFGGHFERMFGLYPVLHLDARPQDLTLPKAVLR